MDQKDLHKEFWNKHLLTWENNFLTNNSPQAYQHLKCIEIAKKLKINTSIMELGCGTGLFAEDLLEEKNFEYHGFDFSSSAMEGSTSRITTASFKKVPINSMIKYISKYPFEYQAVISIEVLPWLSEEDMNMIAKLSKGKKYIHTFISKPDLIQSLIDLFKGYIAYGKDYQFIKEKFYKDEDILKLFPDAKIITSPELKSHKIITNI